MDLCCVLGHCGRTHGIDSSERIAIGDAVTFTSAD